MLLGYTLRPRIALYVEPRYSLKQLQRMQRIVGGAWLLCPRDSALIRRFQLGAPVELLLPGRYSDYRLFRLPRDEAALTLRRPKGRREDSRSSLS